MNKFLKNLEKNTNLTYTENGALTHKTSNNYCLDFFALAGSFRNRGDIDIIRLFLNAFSEEPLTALKLLFYMRDIRNGQGEKRLFRVIINELANMYPNIIKKNIENIIEFGRWDDLFSLYYTNCEIYTLEYIKKQFYKDLESEKPSLLGKWLPSENTSSQKTKILAKKTRKYLKLSSKNYRKSLSSLRKKINIVETLMSQNNWKYIQYDKIPSKAGLKYRKAFYKHDKERYNDFILNKNKVNAKTLYPYEIINKVFANNYYKNLSEIEIKTLDNYWNNLKDYFNGKEYNTLCVVDTSGSMYGTPLNVALSLGLYTAERAKGPFQNHFITFSDFPELIKIHGNNIYEKVINMSKANWNNNTNIKKVFDLLLNTAKDNNCTKDEMPQNIIIISDMEFDDCCHDFSNDKKTVLEIIKKEWKSYNYKLPNLIFWNVDARQNNIPMLGEGDISYISGFSPSIFETVLSNKSGKDLMMEVINNHRYDNITL